MATLKNTTVNDTGHLTIPVGTTAQRPASPAAGMIRMNSSTGALEWYSGASWINTAGNIISSGLVLHLDAANPTSYSGSGTAWNDLSGNGNHFTINATAYNSSGPKYMDFNGSYGCAKKTNSDLSVSGNVTVMCWTRVLNSSSSWRTLLRGLSSGGDHHVIIQSGGWEIGMYDNVNGTGFNGSGYSQQSLPNYGTSNWVCMHWRYNAASTPYYTIGINDSPGTVRGSNNSSNAGFKCGVSSIGAHNNAVQTDPSNASQYWGDIGAIAIYNRRLSDAEIITNFNVYKTRFGL